MVSHLFPGNTHLIAPHMQHALCCRCWKEDALGMALLKANNFPVTSHRGTNHLWLVGSMCQEYALHCRGREEAGRARSIQQRGKVNKQSEKETGHLGKLQSSYLTGSIPPVWHIATDISSSGSRCHMAQNACLLLLHCHMPTLPWHLKKPQLHLCNSCEPLLGASMLILLEMFATFESNWSWQWGTDTLLLFCQQLALRWLVQTSRELGRKLRDKPTGAVTVSSEANSACTKPAPAAALWPLLFNSLKFYTVINKNIIFQIVIWVTRGSWLLLLNIHI